MNNHLVEQVGRIVEIYRKINVPFEKLCKCSESIDSLTEQKELSQKGSVGEWIISVIIADIPFTLLMSFVHPLILLPFMIVTVVIFRKKLHEFNVKRQNFDERIAKQEQLMAEYQSEIDAIFSEYEADISVLPYEFRKELATMELIEMFYRIVATGRADSIKEAINVFYDDMRKMRMEEDNRHAAYCQEQMLQSVKNAEYQAQRTADMIALQNLFSNNNN